MMMHLAFATAINADADVLLIDEALAVGDAPFKEKCYRDLWRVKGEGKTIVFVTHAMNLVTQFCDRMLLLAAGQLIAVGEPRDVVTGTPAPQRYAPAGHPCPPSADGSRGRATGALHSSRPLAAPRTAKTPTRGRGYRVNKVWGEEAPGRRSTTEYREGSRAPVAQWREQRFPKPRAHVRFVPGALFIRI